MIKVFLVHTNVDPFMYLTQSIKYKAVYRYYDVYKWSSSICTFSLGHEQPKPLVAEYHIIKQYRTLLTVSFVNVTKEE